MVKNSLAKFIFCDSGRGEIRSTNIDLFDPEKELLVHDFTSFLDELSALVKGELEISISLLPADAFSHEWIAVYHAQHSTVETFEFSFNEEALRGLHIGILDVRRIELQKAVLHELMHALDHTVIAESRNVYHQRSRKMYDLKSGEIPSNFWLFMHYLSSIRNEGVAMLAERLFFPNNEYEVENALLHFKMDFEFMLEQCKSIEYNGTYNSKIHSICNDVQRYAGILMHAIVENQPCHQGTFDRMNTLKLAIDIDLSDWLACLIELYREDEFKEHAHALFSYFHQPAGKDALQWDLGQFHELYTYDDGRYLEFLSNMCREKLSIPTIEQKLQNFLHDDVPHDVVNLLKKQSLNLIAIRNNENAELIDWTLSYILLRVDVIDDRLEFVGFLDDWMIMDITAQRLFLKN